MTDLVHPDDLKAAQDRRTDSLSSGSGEGRVELRYLSASGEWRWMSALARPMYDVTGAMTGGLTALRDVHLDVEKRSELEYRAAHDGLTGLLNRSAIELRLGQDLLSTRGSGRHVGVLYLDLDGFKDVNDAYGHAAGDRVLVEMSRRLVASLRETDLVARLGGDEFLVVLTGMRDDSHVEGRARSLLEGLAAHQVPGVPWTTLSVGMASDPGTGDVRGLIEAADAALLRAKAAGKNAVAW